MRKWIGIASLTVALMASSACTKQSDHDSQVLQAADADWSNVGGAVGEAHYSKLTVINDKTVSRLGLAWSLDLPDQHNLEATPIAVNGRIYFSGQDASVYAVDGKTGKLLWQYDPESWRYRPARIRLFFPVNRGVAYDKGKLFVGTADGRLIALDAQRGTVLWSVKTIAEDAFMFITGAPRVAGNLVVIGNGGGDTGSRGYVTAYDVNTGQQAWRFHTVPGNPADGFEQPAMEMAAKTWSGKWWEIGTGGNVWNGMVYDPKLDLLYLGTGNSGPYNPRIRNPEGKDNLFLASIVAIKASTGRYVWHYQMNPNEAWDFKATADLILADVKIDGQRRPVIMQAPTNGFFYVLDRMNGKLLSASKITKVTWADRIDLQTGRPVEAPNIRYEKGPVTIWPGAFGAHNWQPMAFSPATNLVYIPTMKVPATYMSMGTDFPKRTLRTAYNQGVALAFNKIDSDDGTGQLTAIDPSTGQIRWKTPYPHAWNGGVMATRGNLVFQGDGEGFLHAYDATSGEELWRYDAKLGIIGAPMTFSVNGTQYISILVGYGGALGFAQAAGAGGWKYNAQPRRLLTFALDAKKPLPPTAPRDFKVNALDDPSLVLDEARVSKGEMLYGANCGACHGINTNSPGMPAPDLKESAVPLDSATFEQFLKTGPAMRLGMPKYDDFSHDEILSIQHYIRAKARESLGRRKRTEAAAAYGGN